MATTSNGLRDKSAAAEALRGWPGGFLGPLRRILIVAPLLFALATFGIAGYLIAKDRQDTLLRVGERTSSMARMIMAHGEAAADNAEQIINRVSDRVAAWDLSDEAIRTEIAASLREAVSRSAVASGAAVVDASGRIVLNTITARPGAQDVSSRPFWKDHLAGQDDPVIRSDTDPDLQKGTSQFTYSRALRKPGGDIHAVIVVTVFASNFETLYRETANWPSARAGLYTVKGDVLARVQTLQRASQAFIDEINRRIAVSSSGTDLITVEPEPRIVSWQRSRVHPQLFATSSQPVDEALSQWWTRTITVGLFVLAANAAFIAFIVYAFRTNEARQRADANEIAVREVSHRVKNSLQMIVSLLRLRGRKHQDPHVQKAITEITNNLLAVAEAHRLVHSAASLETVDIVEALKGLCRHLEQTYGRRIDCHGPQPVMVDAAHATTLSVIANELATNAIKYGKGRIELTCVVEDRMLHLSVTNSGGALPEGFDPESTQGFGLRAVRTMLVALAHSTFSGRSLEPDGVTFEVTVPMKVLEPKRRPAMRS